MPEEIAKAVNAASAPFDNPDTRCPAIKSLTALVISRPGTRGITEEMIIVDRSWPTPTFIKKYDINPTTRAAKNSVKNFIVTKRSRYIWHEKPAPPAMNEDKKSFHPPLNIIKENPLAIEAAAIFTYIGYLGSSSSICLKFVYASPADISPLLMLLEILFTRITLFKS